MSRENLNCKIIKKLFLCVAIASVAAVAYAASMPQMVVTDCGTVHQIPDNATPEQAVQWQYIWTLIDCPQ